MVSIIIEFGLGYFLWKYVPKMITKCSKKTKRWLEIIGIVLMALAVISLVSYLGSFTGL